MPSHPREGVSIEALQELLAGRAGRTVRACMVIPNFSNPTGSAMPMARKRQLLRLCQAADIALIEDDVYGDLPHNGPRPLPIKTLDIDGRVLLCSSFSKTLAPGMRVGFIAPGRYRDRLRAVKNLMSGASAMLPQEVVADYLASGRYERHLRKLRLRCAEQVDRISMSAGCIPARHTSHTSAGWLRAVGGVAGRYRHTRAVRPGDTDRSGFRARDAVLGFRPLWQLPAAQLRVSGHRRYRGGDPQARHSGRGVGQNAQLNRGQGARS